MSTTRGPCLRHFSASEDRGDVLIPAADTIVADTALSGLLSSHGRKVQLTIADICKSYAYAQSRETRTGRIAIMRPERIAAVHENLPSFPTRHSFEQARPLTLVIRAGSWIPSSCGRHRSSRNCRTPLCGVGPAKTRSVGEKHLDWPESGCLIQDGGLSQANIALSPVENGDVC